MKKVGILVLAAATAMVLAVGGGSAMAVSPAQQACEAGPDGITGTADDGVYSKAPGSTASCAYPETTKDVNGNAFGTATQTTDTGQGNLNNRPESECTGNQGQCKQQ